MSAERLLIASPTDMYESIQDLPFVCRLNLPEDALDVYRRAYNEAWKRTRDRRAAQLHAWSEVRIRFVKDSVTGRWIAR